MIKVATIIGHGSSPTGKGWGPQIDQSNIVIRMFDSAWQNPTDYGLKTHIGCFTMAEQFAIWYKNEPRINPNKWWVYCAESEHFDFDTGDKPKSFFSLPENTIIAQQKNTVRFGLTRGTANALFAIKKLKPHLLVLVGFDEVKAGHTLADGYSPPLQQYLRTYRGIEPGPRPDKQSLIAHHDYALEKDLILKTALKHQTIIKFAEDIW